MSGIFTRMVKCDLVKFEIGGVDVLNSFKRFNLSADGVLFFRVEIVIREPGSKFPSGPVEGLEPDRDVLVEITGGSLSLTTWAIVSEHEIADGVQTITLILLTKEPSDAT